MNSAEQLGKPGPARENTPRNMFDAVIVGMGPVGVSMANLLAPSGMKILLVDRLPSIYPHPRAIGFDHEIMRICQQMRVADEIQECVRPYPGTRYMGVDGEEIKYLGHEEPPYDLAWHSGFSFNQPEFEVALRDKLIDHSNIHVRTETELLAFSADKDGVDVSLRDQEHAYKVHARFLFASDGARSTVRKLLDIKFADRNFDQKWLVVDAWIKDGANLPEESRQFCSPSRPTTYVVGPKNLRRWELRVLPHEEDADFETEDAIRDVLRQRVDPDYIDIWRSAIYRFHALVADEWRDTSGRVFLLGDAAHQQPPFMGQGMCAGMRDAANLSWKILAVEKGANPDILDTYKEEMCQHVIEIIEVSKGLGKMVGELDEAVALERDRKHRSLMERGTVSNMRMGLIPPIREGLLHRCKADDKAAGALFVQPFVRDNGVDVRQEDVLNRDFLFVSLGQTPQSWLDDKGRALFDRLGSTRIAVVGLEDDAPSDAEDYQMSRETQGVVKAFGQKHNASWFIVRPDRYVFAAGQSADELKRAVMSLGEMMYGAAS